MEPISNVIEPGTTFRHVFILESMNWLRSARTSYDPAQDLVLTYDFALRREVEALGGLARYVDHLCEQSVMQENNFLIYRFFRDWHLDANGEDIFRYRGVDFGFSFRIDIWNDFTFYVRSRLCLEQLRTIAYGTLFVGTGQGLVENALGDMGLNFRKLERCSEQSLAAYFFPIHRWMDERLRIRRMRHVIRDILIATQGIVMSWYDWLNECFCARKRIFLQEYHPTRQLLQCLQRQPGLQVVLNNFSANRGIMQFLSDRPLPIYGNPQKYRPGAVKLIEAFRQRRSSRIVLSNGVDVTAEVNQLIEQRISDLLPKTLQALDCVIRYLDRHPLKLVILVSNIGQIPTLVDSVAKNKGVPSYMIINGLLNSEYLDEAKYATVINGYQFGRSLELDPE